VRASDTGIFHSKPMKFSAIIFLCFVFGCQQKNKTQAEVEFNDCKSLPNDSSLSIVNCLFDFDTAKTYTEPICLTTDFGGKIILGAKPDSVICDFLIDRPDPNGVFQDYWPILKDYLGMPSWTDESGYGTVIYTAKDFRGYLLAVSAEAPFTPSDREVLAKYFPCFQDLALPQTSNFEATHHHTDFTETFMLRENGSRFSYHATLRRR